MVREFHGMLLLSGGDQRPRTSTLIRDRQNPKEEQENFQGESDGSSSTRFQDSSLNDGDARHDFWSISGNFIYSHHVESIVKLYAPREESFPYSTKIHRRVQNYRHILGCNVGEKYR